MDWNTHNRHRAPGAAPIGLADAVARLRAGELTSEQLTRDCLARIAQREPVVRAWAWLDPERAIEQAKRCDRAIAAGDRRPLAGIPVGIKDVIRTAGIPTEMGSPVYAGYVPDDSASVVKLLEQAGAFVFGKTVTTEFAAQHPGLTTHPWNSAYSPGGSSSGSAAAVAAGFVPVALGTQTRGSTIRPAAYCGIAGYKPTYGLLPADGLFEQSKTLDHIGLIGAGVRDVAALMDALVGACDTSLMDPIGLSMMEPDRPLRLIAVKSPVWHLADRTQADNFHACIRRLRATGAHVEERELPDAFSGAMDAVRSIQLREIADLYADKLPLWGERVSVQFREYVNGGTRIPRAAYQEALGLRERLTQALGDLYGGADAIITPPATGEAPLGLKFTGDASFCAIWTLCGAPAISVFSGVGSNGLPLGLQVVGAPRTDRATLRAAHVCEQILSPAAMHAGGW